jgi:hypothetical protein
MQTEDGTGRPLPSVVLGRLSPDGDGSASLADQLHPPHAASAAFSSSRAWRTSGSAPPARRERAVVSYGPGRLTEMTANRTEAVSFIAQTGATGRGQQGLTLPLSLDASSQGSSGTAVLSLRAVAGPDQLGEMSHEISWLSAPRLTLLSPDWVRPGDELVLGLEMRAGDGASSGSVCGAEMSVGGAKVEAFCTQAEPRPRMTARTTVQAGARSLDVAATLGVGSNSRLTVQREVPVMQSTPVPSTAGELARQLARGLAQPDALGGQADLACAAVRALGEVLPAEQKPAAGAVARLGQLERPEGGFGPDKGELRRDLAALEGLTGLRGWADPGLLDRTRARVLALGEHLDEDQRRALWFPDDRRGAQVGRGALDVRSATALDLAHRIPAHRGRGTAAASAETLSVLKRLMSLLPSADVLDLAEIAVALKSMPATLRFDAQAVTLPAVARQYRLLHRLGWTEALLASGEEPPEPTLAPPSASPLPLGAEVAVSLSAEVGAGGVHCLRDSLPAGFAPIGLPASVGHDGFIVLCGEPREGRLSLGYSLRALHVGRFQAPPAVAGVVEVDGAGAASQVEVAQ